MTAHLVLDILTQMCYFILKLSAPLMLTAFIVGVMISLLQAITQIQEVTLAFIPKLVAVVFFGLWLMPYVLPSFAEFSQALILKITESGGR